MKVGADRPFWLALAAEKPSVQASDTTVPDAMAPDAKNRDRLAPGRRTRRRKRGESKLGPGAMHPDPESLSGCAGGVDLVKRAGKVTGAS
ncbi:hypothetical protein GCM10009038_02070 [Salinicola rhizosphaerae]|uniref:Uncharacterized protein n=1 Tax=Salinicola rhizosphaerae TaxID=1443141 RepID=A0ABQ3DUR7_9GAMM|nr:hypothetical protein GCM10009038_02070 [Salinicola rhizosphaerae]